MSDAERTRVAVPVGEDQAEPTEPPRYTRETLPMGDALVCRHGTMWAARLIDGSPEVIVTISGHGADPNAVRLEPVTDLAPMLAARNEMFGRLPARRSPKTGCGRGRTGPRPPERRGLSRPSAPPPCSYSASNR